MGYLHITNLYRTNEAQVQALLNCKRVYALEKIHGTSAHIQFIPSEKIWNNVANDGSLTFFSGGESHSRFLALFDQLALKTAFLNLGVKDSEVMVYGEAYGGSQQGMSGTYGKNLKFVAFDVKIGDSWLSVPNAETICKGLGIEFVHYVEVSTDLAELDAQRDADSVQAIRNGVGEGKKREGVILRPLVELTLNNGSRVIAKHKRDEFRETASPRVVDDPAKLKVLADAEAVATEWVVIHRLEHVLQKIPNHGMEKMREIISAMVEDVLREGAGEIVDSTAVRKAISTKTATMYKSYLQAKLRIDASPSPA
jgi:hypothetical protein